ncbi:unnamed protein product [Caenorhabditis brenneri]
MTPPLIADYSNLYNAAFALLRLILGDFNFSALESCNRFFGPAFFIAYVFFVSFILLNMFLAIINDSYVEVKAELARKKDGEGILDWFMNIADYSNLYNAAFALLRLILGDFNFSALESCNRFFGPAFFIAYVFFVSFILLNMFLAIINDSYVEVKAELARKKDGEGILDWFMNKVRGLTKRGKRPDAPGEDATYEDYKIMLYRAGYAEKDINEAFTRFNVTTMTEHIPEKMAEDIAGEVARMTEQKRHYMENHRDYAKNGKKCAIFQLEPPCRPNARVRIQYCGSYRKCRVQQQDGGNLMDLSNLLTNQVRNREATRRQTITQLADKKEE